ncbi:hypothetical protein CPB83DRAFT_315918 [Crepidotus variabilis]|uniref:Mediator complex subunit 1 n=1 Tax=Crepidotus variabilis TaxID=179855 RepID=A0A9P6EGP1_9AGAR|nr:hypothetical protein CPB83DRAFT_315918 [Crepidotus variabilis]
MQDNASTSKTLLAALEPFSNSSNFSKDAVHPFALGAPDATNMLQELIRTTDQLSNSLRIYETSAQWTNAKLISQLRQHSNYEHTALSSSKGVENLVDALKTRSGVSYGENVPLQSSVIPDWCVNQLVSWGTSVGMETFKDDSKPGSPTVVLGGKVLVIDAEFAIDRTNVEKPTLKIINVKTSHALGAGHSTNPSLSTPLDSFLSESFREYCDEMQKGEESRDSQRASVLRRRMIEHLKYLVLLDGLASRKEDGAIKWFTDVDELTPTLKDLARGEAQAIAASLKVQKAPLDVFLLRSHCLPLPYQTVPSISFLIHISPAAYLTLLRKLSPSFPGDAFPLDIPLSVINAGVKESTKGMSTATLLLNQLSEASLYLPSMSMPNITTRPSFPLHPQAAETDHPFPQIDSLETNLNPPGLGVTAAPVDTSYTWVLDFTDGGKKKGVVMNQSRMKAIELVLNPLSGGTGLNAVSDVLSLGSWIDLLLNPDSIISSERYTSLYKSPSNIHPPLQLRLTAPEEPGYRLERIPVHSLKEVWGILEIVREQCWLNETLLSCHWAPEGLTSAEDDSPADDADATEAELQAVLAGTFTPRKLPVNVTLPSSNETDNLFGPSDLDLASASKPKIVMTAPERPPISGLVEVTVAYDEKESRGINVSLQGAMGLDISTDNLAEVCRRGGTWGLPGRIWASGQGSS